MFLSQTSKTMNPNNRKVRVMTSTRGRKAATVRSSIVAAESCDSTRERLEFGFVSCEVRRGCFSLSSLSLIRRATIRQSARCGVRLWRRLVSVLLRRVLPWSPRLYDVCHVDEDGCDSKKKSGGTDLSACLSSLCLVA